ncbi:MAG TPA: hypothetical protein VGF95_16395 [Solirubrobacteraceae bacterium]|jgi:hypothetical protein
MAIQLVVGLVLVVPASALASPPTAQIGSVRALSGTEALVAGSITPGLQETSYQAAYALAGSTWCTSHGASGAPLETTTKLLRFRVLANDGELASGEADEGEAAQKVEAVVTGLTTDDEYCFELVATNDSGVAHSGQVSHVAGMPEIVIESLRSISTDTIEIESGYTPELTGSEATAYLEYALASSEWCESEGAAGSASRAGRSEYLSSEHVRHSEYRLGMLSAGDEYCVEAVVEDSGGSAARSAQATLTAGAPRVRHTSEQQLSPTSDRIEGAIDTAEQETEYLVEYGLGSSGWCESGGTSGTSEGIVGPTSIPSPEIVASPLGVKIELTGLTQGAEYCAELIAENTSGAAGSGEIALPMGAPGLNTPPSPPPAWSSHDLAPQEETVNVAGVGDYRLGLSVNPNGEGTEYFAEYGPGSSEWCRKEGDAGTPEATTPAARLPGGFDVEYVSIELAALSPNTTYCTMVLATNGKETVRSFEILETWSPLTETISLAGLGSGIVTGKMLGNIGPGAPVACPGACTATYLENDAPAYDFGRPPGVSLTATPATGSVFAGWGGDCTNDYPPPEVEATCCPTTQAACVVQLAADTNATTATFDVSNPSGGSDGGVGSNGNAGGGTGSASGGADATDSGSALTCTLSPSDRVKLARRGRHRRLRLTRGTLSIGVACDQGASVKLMGTLTEIVPRRRRDGKRSHRRTFALSASSVSVQAQKPQKLTIELPPASIEGLEHGASESVGLALSGSGAAGSTKTSATIAKLVAGASLSQLSKLSSSARARARSRSST